MQQQRLSLLLITVVLLLCPSSGVADEYDPVIAADGSVTWEEKPWFVNEELHSRIWRIRLLVCFGVVSTLLALMLLVNGKGLIDVFAPEAARRKLLLSPTDLTEPTSRNDRFLHSPGFGTLVLIVAGGGSLYFGIRDWRSELPKEVVITVFRIDERGIHTESRFASWKDIRSVGLEGDITETVVRGASHANGRVIVTLRDGDAVHQSVGLSKRMLSTTLWLEAMTRFAPHCLLQSRNRRRKDSLSPWSVGNWETLKYPVSQ